MEPGGRVLQKGGAMEKIGRLTATDGETRHLFEVYRDAGTYAVTLDGETIKTGMTHTNAVAHIVKECQRRGWVQTY